jgi:hypothetical protein
MESNESAAGDRLHSVVPETRSTRAGLNGCNVKHKGVGASAVMREKCMA